MILAAAGPSPLWYLSRGTGAITLVLLSATVLLGITGTLRWRPGMRTPRFVVDGLHRNVSLLVVVLLAAHILTAVLDPFAHLRVLDAFIPFASHYRPLWLGFGALSFDLLLALIVTSLLRARLGLRAWRAVHWAAYLCWPVAVLHGLGTGTDARSVWLQALTAVCVGAVVIALAALVVAVVRIRLAGRFDGVFSTVSAALVAQPALHTTSGFGHREWAPGTDGVLHVAASHGPASIVQVLVPLLTVLAVGFCSQIVRLLLGVLRLPERRRSSSPVDPPGTGRPPVTRTSRLGSMLRWCGWALQTARRGPPSLARC